MRKSEKFLKSKLANLQEVDKDLHSFIWSFQIKYKKKFVKIQDALNAVKRERVETTKEFEGNVFKPTRVYLKHLIRRFPETEERVSLIISRMKEEQAKLQDKLK